MPNKLTLEEKIGQMFMIGFDGIILPDKIKSFIVDKNIGGIILFSRNINSIEQVVKLNKQLHLLGKTTPMIWTDQEGGNIVRFGEMAATGISHMGITQTNRPENAKIIASLIAKDMKALGIDGVFAPVLDVNINEKNPVIGIRSFSDKPDIVVKYAEQFIAGLNNEGIASCAKHYPGHGAASADSHLEIPKILLSIDKFEKLSIFPFLELSDKLDSIMTAHVKYPNISDKIATFSKEFIDERYKNNSNFEGIVFSDCLEMKAISDNFSAEEIVYNSINAGIDVMIVSHTFSIQEEYYKIALNLVKTGVIKEERIDESVSRILKLKNKYKTQIKKQSTQLPAIRQDIDIEKKIALSSINILKNNNNKLPIKKDTKTLFIEFTNKITSPAVLSEKASKLEQIVKESFNNSDSLKLSLSDNLDIKKLSDNIDDYKNIVIFIYSFTGETKKKLNKIIEKLFKKRDDIIIISLENPYEINDLSFINTFICSYGFRDIQIEAVLETLKTYQQKVLHNLTNV